MVVGRIQGPYGIKGWVHVASFTDPRENILNYRPWQLAPAGIAVSVADSGKKGEARPIPEPTPGSISWPTLEVDQIRPHKQGYVARLVGIEDRNAAEKLKGRLIGVSEQQFPAPEAGEYYWRDLVGARVVNADGQTLGEVDVLLETGAHDVLVIKATSGSEGERVEELLIPFHPSYVEEVDVGQDIGQGLIRVNWDLSEAD